MKYRSKPVLIFAANPGLGIGDFISIIPLLKMVKSKYPSAQIELCLPPAHYVDLLKYFPVTVNPIIMPTENYNQYRLPWYFIRKFRRKHYQLYFSSFLDRWIWNSLAAAVVKAEVKIGAVDGFKERFAYSVFHKGYYEGSIYFYEKKDVLSSFGFTSPPQANLVNLPDHLPDNKLISIHPGGGKKKSIKRWRLNKFLKLSKILWEKKRIKSQYFLGPEECYNIPNDGYLEVHANISLIQAVQQLLKARYFISGDTGFLHLASALGLRSFALLGPNYYEYLNMIYPSLIVISRYMECSPCSNHLNPVICKVTGTESKPCLDNLTAEYVYEIISKNM